MPKRKRDDDKKSGGKQKMRKKNQNSNDSSNKFVDKFKATNFDAEDPSDEPQYEDTFMDDDDIAVDANNSANDFAEDENDIEKQYESSKVKLMEEQSKKIMSAQKNLVLPVVKDGKVVFENMKNEEEEMERIRKNKQELLKKGKRQDGNAEEDEENSGEDDDMEQIMSEGKKKREQRLKEEQKKSKKDPDFRMARIEKKKQEIADLSTKIFEKPDGPEMSGMLEKVIDIYLIEDFDRFVKKLALLSLLELFRQLIPDYKVNTKRLNNEKTKKGTQLSKEISSLRSFETGLLANYQKFVQFCVKHTFNACDLCSICLKVLGETFQFAAHFNFADTIMTCIVSKLNAKNQKISKIAFDSICSFLKNDPTKGEMTSVIIQSISRSIFDEHKKVLEDSENAANQKKLESVFVSTKCIDVFLFAPLRSSILEGDETSKGVSGLPIDLRLMNKKEFRQWKNQQKQKNDKRKKNMAKKMKKVQQNRKNLSQYKSGTELENDMGDKLEKEVLESEFDPEALAKRKRETDALVLRNIIVTYARLIKQIPKSPLIFSALQGIQKFADLLNSEILYDLVIVLHKFFENEDIKTEIALQCVVTNLVLLRRGLGMALNIDTERVQQKLFEILNKEMIRAYDATGTNVRNVLAVIQSDAERQHAFFKMFLEATYLLFFKIETPKTVPAHKVAAFVKKFNTYALSLPPLYANVIQVFIAQMLYRYNRIGNNMFSGEEVGLAGYNFFADNAEQSQPFATSPWEMNLLINHVNPEVANNNRRLLQSKIAKLAAGGAMAALDEKDVQLIAKEMTLEDYDKLLEKKKL